MERSSFFFFIPESFVYKIISFDGASCNQALDFFTRYQDEILKSSCDFRNTQEKSRWKAENAYVENNLFSTIISVSE